MRLTAMSDMRFFARADAKTLESCGYRGKTQAEAVLDRFLHHEKKIETTLRAWEKANPGK
jgi:hypothetical protein